MALVFRSGKGHRVDYKGILCDREKRGQLFSGEKLGKDIKQLFRSEDIQEK